LTAVLPEENNTWLLKDAAGDVMAYFHVAEPDPPTADQMIIADISGRHYNCDADVVAVLQKLKAELGGEIANDA
jgi:hypothetical protein